MRVTVRLKDSISQGLDKRVKCVCGTVFCDLTSNCENRETGKCCKQYAYKFVIEIEKRARIVCVRCFVFDFNECVFIAELDCKREKRTQINDKRTEKLKGNHVEQRPQTIRIHFHNP